MDETRDILGMTADIISAFVSKNAITPSDLPNLIQNVHGALNGINVKSTAIEEPAPQPAISIKKSISTDYIVCLEDGRKFKSLKRHLRTKYGISPEDYRAKWGLPKDYPMVAPSYAAARSNLAKQMGLGQNGRISAQTAPSPSPSPAKIARKTRVKA